MEIENEPPRIQKNVHEFLQLLDRAEGIFSTPTNSVLITIISWPWYTNPFSFIQPPCCGWLESEIVFSSGHIEFKLLVIYHCTRLSFF